MKACQTSQWTGVLFAALALLIGPAEAQRSRNRYSVEPPQRGQVWRSDRPQSRTAEAPLPPRRPPQFAPAEPQPPQAPPASQTTAIAVPAGDDAETCVAVVAGGTVVAETLPAVHSGACGIEHPLMLKAIVLADKRQISLEPPIAMRCRLASAIAAWIIEDVAPAVANAGSPLKALSGVGGYECRGRNGIAGAKLSEHAIGNAMDLGALKLADGRTISVQEQTTAELFEKIRASACARFATVLGPGADPSHKTHLHLDLQERRHGYKICQWDVAPATPATADQARSPNKPADATQQKKEDGPLSRARASARRR